MEKMASTSRGKKIRALIFLLTLTGMTGLFAQDIIRLTPPVLRGSDPYVPIIQSEIDSKFRDIQNQINSELGLSSRPQKMIGAFASSSVFSSMGASLRTYQGYNTFALMLGTMVGVQFPPVSIFSILFGSEDVVNKILYDSSDIRLGANPQIINAQVGVNTSRFLLKGLYLGLKGGYMNLPIDLGIFSLSFQTWSAGGMINYQFLPQQRLGGGLFVWRGLSVGAGFIYQGTSLNVNIPLELEDITDESFDIFDIEGTKISGYIRNVKLGMNFGITTYTVPLEVSTAIRLLGFFNLSLGLGADFAFGIASLRAGGDAELGVDGLPPQITYTPGRVSISMGGSNSPSLLNPKVMGSLGFSVGPAIILDIPVTYYFLNNGYNVGISFGIAL